jgi:uncharacterized protein
MFVRVSAPVTRFLALAAFILLLVTTLQGGAAAELQFPQLTGRVVDEAGLLTPAERQSLTETLKAHEEATGNQVVVVTLRSLQGKPIEDYGYQLGRFWGIGRQGKDNGVLLIVAPNERKVRIEVGYGLEGVLTDATSRVIIERIMAPAFRSGQFGPGIVAGVGAILKVISGEEEPLPHRRTIGADRSSVGLLPAILIFGGFVLFMWLVYRSRRSSYYASPGRRRGTWIGYGGGYGGGFGGGFGGSGSGGGGGFGGGGGSFGGGGASGDW